jgi:hypothetical protein
MMRKSESYVWTLEDAAKEGVDVVVVPTAAIFDDPLPLATDEQEHEHKRPRVSDEETPEE